MDGVKVQGVGGFNEFKGMGDLIVEGSVVHADTSLSGVEFRKRPYQFNHLVISFNV